MRNPLDNLDPGVGDALREAQTHAAAVPSVPSLPSAAWAAANPSPPPSEEQPEAPAPADVFPQEHPWLVLQRVLGDVASTSPLGELRSALSGCRIMAGLYGPWDPAALGDIAVALVARRQAALAEVHAVDALLREHFDLDLSSFLEVSVYRIGEEFYAATSPGEALIFYREQTGEAEDPEDLVPELEEMDVRIADSDEKVSRSWRDVVNESLARGERPPFWVGSTYD